MSHIPTHTIKSLYPLSKVLSHDVLSPYQKHFALNVSSQFEPRFYSEAVCFLEWREAIQSELDALDFNKTWTAKYVVPLPSRKHSIGCQWIYKINYNFDGSIDRHKARLVAKRYTQQEGVDFLENFSPVAKLVTLKVLLAFVGSQHLHLHKLDVNNAFQMVIWWRKFIWTCPKGIINRGAPSQSC